MKNYDWNENQYWIANLQLIWVARQAFGEAKCTKWQLDFTHKMLGNSDFKFENTELCSPTITFVKSDEKPTRLDMGIFFPKY